MSPSVDPLIAGARFAALALSLGLLGSAAFPLYVPPVARPRQGGVLRPVAALLAALAGLAWLAALTRALAGDEGLPSFETLMRVASLTVFGRLLAAATALAGLLAFIDAVGTSGPRLRLALAAALLACEAVVGHASGGIGISGVIRQVAMVAHLLAAGVWLGGLPPLALALRRPGVPTAEVLEAFGKVALLAVLIALGAGLISILYVVISVRGAVGPVYLRAFTIKLSLVGALLMVAVANRFWLTPQARRRPGPASGLLHASLALEQALALALLAAVAVLGQLDPMA